MNEEQSISATFCHQCGSRSVNGASFCHFCGTKLATTPPPVEPSTGGNAMSAARVDTWPTSLSDQEAAQIVEMEPPPEGQPAVNAPTQPASTGAEGDGVAEATGVAPAPRRSEVAAPAYSFPFSASLRFETLVLDQPRERDTLAGPKGNVTRWAAPGEVFWVTGAENGFARVHEGRRYGYIRGDALGLELRPAPQPKQPDPQRSRAYGRAQAEVPPPSPVRHYARVPGTSYVPRRATGQEGLLGRLLFLLGGIGMVASPFLPWVKVSFILSADASLYTLNKAMDDYSALTEVLILGGVTVFGGVLRNLRVMNLAWARVWGVLCGAGGIVEVTVRYYRFQDQDTYGLVTLQFGFYLLAIASVVAIVGVIIDSDG